jgi:hypothetical protein
LINNCLNNKMKNNRQESIFSNFDLATKKNSSMKKAITTDVNILLNRVRLDKKKKQKKKLFFLGLLLTVICSFVIFAIT